MTDDTDDTPSPEPAGAPADPPVAPFPPYLLERFDTWHRRRFAPDRIWRARLAEDGQRPRAMVVSCCDSRMEMVQMFGAEPGDLFVVRNVANLVPPYTPDHNHHGTSAAVEYAVNVLRVSHILVVGHSDCGGVAACEAMCSGGAVAGGVDGGGFVGRWMDILRPGWARIAHLEGAARARALEQQSVVVSLENLAGFPFVAEALARGRLSLHGAWVDIAHGRLHAYEGAHRGFVAVGGGP